jgi:hypothetical protein
LPTDRAFRLPREFRLLFSSPPIEVTFFAGPEIPSTNSSIGTQNCWAVVGTDSDDLDRRHLSPTN